MSRDQDDTFDRFQPHERGRFGDREHGRDRVEKVKLVDIEAAIVFATRRGGLLVTTDGTEENAVWLSAETCQTEPKGETWVTMRDGYQSKKRAVVITLPAALAQEKGLI